MSMNALTHNPTTRLIASSILLLLIATGACSPSPPSPIKGLGSTPASSGNTSLEGRWTGWTDKDAKAALTLTSSSGTLEFGASRNCRLDLGTPHVATDNSYTLRVKHSDGGFCDYLLDGAVVLKSEGRPQGRISCQLISNDNRHLETLELGR